MYQETIPDPLKKLYKGTDHSHKKKSVYLQKMYLDPQTRTKVEETGGANFIFVTKDKTVVTPKSNSILPSITRRSLLFVVQNYLGLFPR